MRGIVFFTVIGFFLLFACKKSGLDTEMCENLEKYLKEVQNISLFDSNYDYVIVLQDGFCNNCNGSSKLVLQQLSDLSNILVISSKRVNLNKSIKLCTDKKYLIEQYGLRSASDLFYQIDKNRIVYFSYINNLQYDKLIRKFANQ